MPRNPEHPPEGAMISSEGKITDADFHRIQMGLDAETEETLSLAIDGLREGLLEDQAIRYESTNKVFARKIYKSLVRRFPESDRLPIWQKKISDL